MMADDDAEDNDGVDVDAHDVHDDDDDDDVDGAAADDDADA